MKILFSALAFTLYFSLLSEPYKKVEFLPGYVVNSVGDTLKGMVKKSKFTNQKEIKFKDDLGNERSYFASDLKEFKSGLEKYVSIKKSELGYTKYIEDDQIFLLEVDSGQLSLYVYKFCYQADTYGRKWTEKKSYKKECKEYYYFRKQGEPYFTAYIKNSFSVTVVRDKQPIDNFQLAGYFDEYEDLSKKILYKVYKQNQVLLMAQDYNKWVEENK